MANKYVIWWKKGLAFSIIWAVISWILGAIGITFAWATLKDISAGLGGMVLIAILFVIVVGPMIQGYLIERINKWKLVNR